MKAFIVVLALVPIFSFAQSRPELEGRVESALQEARRALKSNIQRMSERDLKQAERKLLDVAEIANGNSNPYPNPGPNPIPTPYPTMTCAQEGTTTFQNTFVKIKNFAYNVANQTSSGAVSYATNWTNKFPCYVADKFIQDYTRIKNHAYNAMNMTSSGSVEYAERMVPRLCSQVQFEQIFNQHKNFAYNTLNMTSSGAVQYATPKMEAEAFYCNNLR